MQLNNPPDWADEMAKEWLQAIKQLYKTKGLPINGIIDEIVSQQGELFNTAIDNAFTGVEFDTPDYRVSEILKLNTWRFSVAKNHNDLIKINNLLVKDDGTVRPWHDFKYEAQKVVGLSNKYLKTEYNTVVSASQMARLWQDIQRDKHIFPFIQFLVVEDGHTSEICKPLINVIVSVDDPMLLYYFPPNHFNCRTTVRRLRRGKPTEKYNLPDIPDAFKNNVGISLKVFTDENPYIKNTPFDVLQQSGLLYAENTKKEFKEASAEIRKQLEEYKLKHPMYQDTDDERVKVSLWVDKDELERNLSVAKQVASKHNAVIKLQPHTDGRFIERPNPEYEYNGMVAERKSPRGLNLKNLFRKAHNKQNCEVIIIDLEDNSHSVDELFNEVKQVLNKKNRYPKIKKVIVVSKDLTETKEFIR